MTAEIIIPLPKHLYVEQQPHAVRFLHDNIIKHKNAQLSYPNRLRPQLLLNLVRLLQRKKSLRKMVSSGRTW